MSPTRVPSLPVAALAALLAMSGGGCAMFPDDGGPPARPVPVSPPDGVELIANVRTRFVWAPVEGALWYDFHVFDRRTNDIDRYRIDELRARDVCDADACSVEMSVSLPRMKDHAWRVRAHNRSGTSEWSRTRFAMVDAGRGGGAPAVPDVLGLASDDVCDAAGRCAIEAAPPLAAERRSGIRAGFAARRASTGARTRAAVPARW